MIFDSGMSLSSYIDGGLCVFRTLFLSNVCASALQANEGETMSKVSKLKKLGIMLIVSAC